MPQTPAAAPHAAGSEGVAMSGPWDGPIIDAHQHFWEPAAGHHPWLLPEAKIPFRYGNYDAIKRRYLPPDYREDAAAHNVVASVYIETEWDPDDPIGETRYASGIAEEYGLPNAIVAQAWLDRADAEEVLDAQAAFALVRSVRHKPGGPQHPDEPGRTLMTDERWRRGYERLGRHGLHFDLQTPWWTLHEACLLARDFPDTLIILNHSGLPSDRSSDGLKAWHKAVARFVEFPNVRGKISGLGQPDRPWTVADNRWIVQELVAMFGAERAMFASNFPVDGLCGSFDDIFNGFKEITAGLSRGKQRKLFHDTARETYRTVHADDKAPAGPPAPRRG
jgi:predicted TIM-barrel fold metal-dependent hydrolase